MLVSIKAFFSAELSLENNENEQCKIQLAAAALLIELSRADYQREPEEQAAIEAALKKGFDLDDAQLATLIDLAEQENHDATSLYQFTNLIKDEYSAEQRFELVKMLWQVAIADGEISKYEDHLIRKIADLIYLPHSQFIKAKLEVVG
ncbi:MAG: TerB family tellurite resistance protein [Oceanicoccus sp.]|uniref:tellurite resistance TerB family protein n=1 Tax=Oceanicoccus sp. TaxID=2691044 RepID=UPI0026368267|nr:TerB family tellurite resistance protein [Oceanicoccus sp.]MCP3908502.1 TerB family tellurite resistance protein [Oceanicoccus sp.]